ncbi:hypothetical protein Salat_1398100 [Sesamum alatum]|uniref:Uncharacterized protein n=1 Tax=Sesamum alatum TaxID=300844 RepID=A0AAE1Y9P4_9LAMI|nr:hypothetical protein Salat_1398100 [Sesamum alatum]
MTRRTRVSSSKEPSSAQPNEISLDSFAVISSLPPKMSAKAIVKTINLLGLSEGFKILTPVEYQWANNPPPGYMTVYAAQCVSGLRFPLHPFLVDLLVTLGISPSQLNLNSYRVKAAGHLNHGFKAKALVEEDLLIVAGLHPVPDPYAGLESRYFHLQTMMNRVAVRNFLPENVPSNPLSSSSTRSASATSSDIQSSGRGQSPSRTPPAVGPSSASVSLIPTDGAN